MQRGETVFEANCAECHGERVQGADGWRQRLPDGTFPPPPLDGSGHAWHHPLDGLRQIITDGQRRMPGFGDELSEEDVDAVIAWFPDHWDDDIHEAWEEYDRRGMAGHDPAQDAW